MPAYQYFPFADDAEFPFPPDEVGKTWSAETTPQLVLPQFRDRPVRSELKYLGLSENDKFYKYAARHETEVQKHVRWFNEDYHVVIFVEEFDLFLPKDMRGVYVKAKGSLARQFMHRMASQHPLHYHLREIDLHKLREKMRIRGGWFKDLDIPDVAVAAIFGANVEDSDDWDRYENAGTISALIVEYPHLGGVVSVNISRHGTITIYGKRPERDALALLHEINSRIKPFTTPPE